ncbi:hypothetical protein SLEP1_g34655 [Rubroshorea leprosula]|uniref:Movement protein binding protein 2C n=1 Tax=Rubroshorea leprosula TaxID=152421 RepID=A0AAV5KKR3_9ROSI|nr:hypothetical protein SLEP1_g34655 [Rubroshorea leprosula]
MFEPQHFMDLQENSGFGDQNSWLSGEVGSSPTHRRIQSSLANSAGSGNVDRVLYNDLVEMIPLVQSLIERKARSSFTRRGSMIYTKTPSRESLSRKAAEPRGRTALQSIPKKKKDQADRDQCKNLSNNQDGDSFSIFSSRAMATENEDEELATLKEKLEDLQNKLVEKDELLKSAEISKKEVNDIHAKFEELRCQTAEKDSLVKSIQLQLSDAKIKLADKQAALEKLQWEAMTSNQKVEKLQEELDSMQGEFSSFMHIFEGLTKSHSNIYAEDYDVAPYHLDRLPYIDDMDDMEMQKMEKARQAYITAIVATKEKQDEESLAAAASARLYLQSLVFRHEGLNHENVGM